MKRLGSRACVVYGPATMVAPPFFARPLAGSLGDHVRRTLRLALPVVGARAGLLILVVVDTAMTGHSSAVELAYFGLAMAPQVPMLLVGIGLLLGTVVLVAQADGAGDHAACGAVWRVALVHAVVIGVAFGLLSQLGEPFLALVDQSPDLAAGGGRVIAMLGWGMPAALGYAATTFFLEGINRPTPSMIVIAIANLLNVGLNWLLIYGNGGFPAMGAEGAALATTIVRWFTLVALVGYVLVRIDRVRYGIGRAAAAATGDMRALGRRLRRIGLPMGLGTGLESSAFATMTLFAGLLGPVQIAAYQISMNMLALVFMATIGFATAASVRVGNAAGHGDAAAARRAGWVAMGLAVISVGLCGILLFTLPEAIARVYTTDDGVVSIAVQALSVAAFVVLVDGAQGVLMGALRGLADVWVPAMLYFVAFWLVMVPLGHWLGVARGGGAPALIIAIGVGCVVAAIALTLRFRVAVRRAAPIT